MSKGNLKLQFVKAIEKAGIFSLSRRFFTSRSRGLLYHRFSVHARDGFVSQEKFKKQVAFALMNFGILFPDKLFQDIDRLGNGVVITVDDGYRDFYEVAYPVLREFEVPAIVYLSTDFIDGKTWLWFDKLDYILQNSGKTEFPFDIYGSGIFQRTSWSQVLERLKAVRTEERDAQLTALSEYLKIKVPYEPPDDYAPLSWEQIREMSEKGIAFGSHTCSHPILTQSELETARFEIQHSKERIEKELGKGVISISYPNGAYNEEITQMVKEAGYEYAFGTHYGLISQKDDRYTLNRLAIGDRRMVYFRQDLCGVDILKNCIRGNSWRKGRDSN
ncbi:putative Polysaccharide deacetylase [uncultured Desulfobacterium sp.]|uniref:Putative Polysaccharide deacetylase n=1 Tax=uncultured Desulfobacterium sp. TaxID=201089 RepID=A0A445MZT0_9BACT|nr:putative Polysaccharide deacetylase [uncultured Desulfobacterium sp.]